MGLFWGLYRLLLSRDRWLQLSRVYLIITMLFSLTYPLIRLPEAAATATISLPAMEVFTEPVATTTAAPVHTLTGMDVYLAGVVLMLAILLLSVVRTIIHLRKMKYVRRGTVKLTLIDDDTAPYSFFNHVVIGKQNMNDEEMQSILAHEELHVRQWHTLDVLLGRVICCLAWFNPFAWLCLRELRAVHEYLADGEVLATHGRKEYLGLLYREATGIGYGHITVSNNFKSINIKNRIIMMNKTKTRFGAWKVLAALPVAALLLMVGCKQTGPAPAENEAAEEQATLNEASVEPELFDYTQNEPAEGLTAPEFEGGMDAFYKYLTENIHYPEQAKAEGIQGRVLVRFVVRDNGDIVNVEVAKGIGSGCDEEAVRVVKAMPKWKPATYEGKAVNVQYALPIVFKLQ